MSAHERAAIRNGVIETLVAAQTECADRVSGFPYQPHELDKLPAISVYGLLETVDQQESSVSTDPDNPGHLKRALHLAAEIVAAGDDGEDALDRIALQVERAVDADPTIGGRASDAMLENTEIGFVSNAERIIAVARLTYTITYYTPTRTAEAVAGVLPSAVYGSLTPKIGAAHKNDYKNLTAGESLIDE